MAPAVEGGALPDRETLKKQLFDLWDQDGDGALKKPELLQLAKATGFDGTDEEWTEEYPGMCAEKGCSPEDGLAEAAVMVLLDDDSDVGCYFTDQELFEILRDSSASTSVGVSVPSAPTASADASSAPSAPNADPDGGSASSAPVAAADESIPETAEGCAEASGADGGSASSAPYVVADEGMPDAAEGGAEVLVERAALKRRLFRVWDKDTDGFLKKDELVVLARAAGFEGSDEEWAAEYPSMCAENKVDPESGFSEQAVMALLDDDSEDGPQCYLSDQDLKEILAETGGDDVVMGGDEVAGNSSSSSSSAAAVQEQLVARQTQKRRLFRLWDQDRDGFLKQDEMMQIALVTGFEGSDEEWTSEYKAMCEEHKVKPEVGFSKAAILALLDDESDQGAYIPTDEIKRLVEVVLDGGPDPENEFDFKIKVVRDEAGKAGFNVRQADLVVTGLERIKDLSPMQNGDRLVAVNGKPIDTFAEYITLAHDVKEFTLTVRRPKQFQDADSWEGVKPGYHFKLGEHGLGYYRDVYNGVFAIMTGIQEFFPASRFQGEWVGHVFKKGHCGLGYYVDTFCRGYFKKRLFELWDADKDGRLNQQEACQFGRDTGFDGSWDQWQKEYINMCSSRHCEPAVGLSETAVADMMEDKTDRGCYLSSEDLQALIERITKALATSKERAELAENAGAPVPLAEIPIARLKALAKLHGVSLAGCLEKGDMVEALKKVGVSDQGAAAVAAAAERQMGDAGNGEEAQERGAFDKKIQMCDDTGSLKKDAVVKMAQCVGWVGEDDEWVTEFTDVYNNQGLADKKDLTIAQAMACAEVAKARLLKQELGDADTGEPAKKKPKLCLPKAKAEPGAKAAGLVTAGLVSRKCEACEKEPPDQATVFCMNCKAFLCPKCDEENHSTKLLKKHKRTTVDLKHTIPSGPPEKKVKEFISMSASELKALAKLKCVDIATCVEKSEIVSALEKAGLKPPELPSEEDKEKENKAKAAPKKVMPPPKKEEAPGDIRPPVKRTNPKADQEAENLDVYMEHRAKMGPGSQWELKTGVALWRNDSGWERTFFINATTPRGWPNVIEVIEYGERRIKVRGMGLDRGSGTLVGQRWQMGWLELSMLVDKESGELLVSPNMQTGQLVTPKPKVGAGVKVLPKAMQVAAAAAATEKQTATKDPEAASAKPEGLEKAEVFTKEGSTEY